MFLNNPASARSSVLAGNENAALRRPKSNVEGGARKASFNENNVAKTPHRNKDAAAPSKGGGGGQTAPRRRRALGDISNRKASGGSGGGGKGGAVVLKQSSSSNVTLGSKPGNGKNRAAQVKFSKTPSTKGPSANNKARLGGSGLKSVNSKPKQRPSSSSEYDGIYGATTRWSDFSLGDEGRSLFDLIPEGELDDPVEKMREERWERREREREESDRLEEEGNKGHLAEALWSVDESNRKDIADLATSASGNGRSDDVDRWDFLDRKLPWEEEDGIYDPAEERRLSGSDPYSLWADNI